MKSVKDKSFGVMLVTVCFRITVDYYLILKCLRSDELHWFKVWMKSINYSEWPFKNTLWNKKIELKLQNYFKNNSLLKLTNNESHCYVVRKPNFITNLYKTATASNWFHPSPKGLTDTEARSPRCKPKCYFLIRLWRC